MDPNAENLLKSKAPTESKRFLAMALGIVMTLIIQFGTALVIALHPTWETMFSTARDGATETVMGVIIAYITGESVTSYVRHKALSTYLQNNSAASAPPVSPQPFSAYLSATVQPSVPNSPVSSTNLQAPISAESSNQLVIPALSTPTPPSSEDFIPDPEGHPSE